MTAQRRDWCGIGRGIALILLISSLCTPLWAGTNERVVTDRYSGLAIGGFDPVAYFTDSEAQAGLPDFELTEDGAVWRFRNEGNRAEFAKHPEIYGPQFGGYDPVDMARGIAIAGNPRTWLVGGQRLYLFSREENRDAFKGAPATFLPAAQKRWPGVQETLAR
jgi:YHS domain-containing protein